MSQHDTLTLEPCPHCGKSHTPKIVLASEHWADEYDGDYPHSERYAVMCDASSPNGPGGCGASGGFHATEDEAVAAWNRRAALSATQPAQAAQPVQGLAPLLERIRPGVAAAPWVVEALQKLAAQAAQGEPAEHWHRLYLEKCQQYNDRVAQLGGVIEGLEAEAAQGAGEVVAWQASDGGSSYISNEARSRNSAFRELYTIPLYIQPAAGADVLKNDARYQWLRSQDDDDFVFAVVKNPHFDVYESPEELDAAIDAAIAASGRQS